MIIYYCPQSNNNYRHNKLLFLTIPKFIKKKIYLIAPENFTSKINLHQFFKLKKNINSNSLNSNISIKILRVIGFIYLSINNTFILYKIIKKVNKKKITLIIDGYNSFDILFIPFILKGIIKIRVLYRDLSFNFLHNFIQNFSFFLISKLNKNLKIIELDSLDKKKSHLSNGKIINHPLISSPQASSIKNVGNNILSPFTVNNKFFKLLTA